LDQEICEMNELACREEKSTLAWYELERKSAEGTGKDMMMAWACIEAFRQHGIRTGSTMLIAKG